VATSTPIRFRPTIVLCVGERGREVGAQLSMLLPGLDGARQAGIALLTVDDERSDDGALVPHVTEFDLPGCEYMSPMYIAPGPDGNVWLTAGSTRIYSITPTGDVHEYELDRSAGDLTQGPDGALWFASANSIGRLVP